MKEKKERLRMYLIDMKYIRELSKKEDNVMSVSPQIDKSTRPFLGIIVICGVRKYCVPLSSPKKKHRTMKNDIDFTKIYDGEKLIGVLNFNDMVPVAEKFIMPMNLKVQAGDDVQTRHYKRLVVKQLSYC